jgi:hypothetical protein
VPGPVIRRLCIAVDGERFSGLDRAGQHVFQRRFADVMTSARTAAGIEGPGMDVQPSGDGQLVLARPAVDETQVIVRFVRGLREALHETNRTGGLRIRLRVAMHSGLTQVSANGYSGDAVITTARMCDSSELKHHLATHAHADLVLALSQSLYGDHVGQDFFDLRTDLFEPMTLTVGKKFCTEARVFVPDVLPGAEERHRRGTEETPTPQQPTSVPSSVVKVRKMKAGRDNTINNIIGKGDR